MIGDKSIPAILHRLNCLRLLSPESRIAARLVHFLNHAANVVADEFRQHFVFPRPPVNAYLGEIELPKQICRPANSSALTF
jgi:hypothetical protein